MFIQNRNKLIKQISKENHYPLSYEEWEAEAAKAILIERFDYIFPNAGRGETADRNQKAFSKWAITPRILNDVSKVNLNISIFGKDYPTPFFLAPIGMHILAHNEGEIATAKAVSSMGIPMIVSTVSSYSLEDIAKSSPTSSKWFQLYWSSNPDIAFSMIERAEKNGYEALVITVDTVMHGWREIDIKNQYSPLSLGLGKANFINDPVFMNSLINHDEESIINGILESIQHPTFSWKDIKKIKKRTKLPILLKGILHTEDAKLALEYDIDGIIVSNHGGRQLDGVIASIDALPEIVEVVQGKIPILFDSGIRRGIDVVKALALGANAILVGRPYIWGLAVHGQIGVEKVMERLIQETEISLALSGIEDLSKIKNVKIIRE
ncbi:MULTISPECIES: alpha-hydroxy acid oxidase [Bacillus]|uniref:alpha-hydroxy acid oxidase n=1 Tax=Bacillus TaxID=1386 RepID=UPI000315AF83|nr:MULTISPECIES: alpha-hydroxy acid oxidase [Bacillus]